MKAKSPAKKKARRAPVKKTSRRTPVNRLRSATGSARRKGRGDTAGAAFRAKLAALPRGAYQELEATPKSFNANLADEAERILHSGWHHQGLHLASLAPPVDWQSDNRSFSFCLHAWTPLSVLLVVISRDHETPLGRRCLQAAVDFASDWLRHFQAPVLAKGVPHLFTKTAASRYGLAWYDMAVGQRINRLAFILDAASRDARFSDDLIDQLMQSLRFHHRLLARDDFFRLHSNHGLYQALGQLAAARRFQAVDAAQRKYAALAEKRLDSLLQEQFSPSGMHKEHSPGYHYITGASLSGALANGLLADRPGLGTRLSRIEEALSWMIKPDLSLPSIGDTDPVRLPRSDFMADRCSSESMRWAFTRGQTGTRPPLGVASFKDAGYACARLAAAGKQGRFADTAFLAQIAGFHSRIHKHADHLSFIWYDKGCDIFIDPGRYAYAGKTEVGTKLFKQGFWYSDPKRIYCESTRAHNTVEIDGKSFPRMGIKPFGSALLQAEQQNGLAVTFCETVHFRRIRHQRQIIMGPGRFLLVLDWLYDRTGEPHDYRQFFHFGSGWNVARDGDGIIAEHPGQAAAKSGNPEPMFLRGATLMSDCSVSEVARGQTEPDMLGWVSDRANRLVPASCFHVHAKGTGPTSIATLFVFGDQLTINKKKTRLNVTMSAGVVAWEDSLGRCEVKISRNEGGVAVRSVGKLCSPSPTAKRAGTPTAALRHQSKSTAGAHRATAAKSDKLAAPTAPRKTSTVDYLALYRAGGVDGVTAHIRSADPSNALASARELVTASRVLRDAGFTESEYPLTAAAKQLYRNNLTLKSFFWAAQRAGRYRDACDAIHDLEQLWGGRATADQVTQLDKLKASPAYQLTVLRAIRPRKARPTKPVAGRICYVLHNSLPYSSGGYATRSHGVAEGLTAAGLEVICLTRPGFPLDIKDDLKAEDLPSEDAVEGLRYVRSFEPLRTGRSMLQYVLAAADTLELQLRQLRPETILAASNHVTGLPALIAARRVGVPFCYEVRGLWEITRLSREISFKDTARFLVQSQLEASVCEHADHVFTLTEAMREELVTRGASRDKIDLVPNSCDPQRFTPTKRNTALARKLGIPRNVPVIGYIGTFVDYEGLEDLAAACAILKKRGIDFRLLLVGNENASGQDRGPITAAIQEIAATNGFADWLIMPGRVPHEEVERYYSLLDICPFPRKPLPVCEMVSPMKPLEAFAMEKAVVVSSVRALQEMVTNDDTGLVFNKGDVEDLAAKLAQLVADPLLRTRLGGRAREWVARERTWKSTARRLASQLQTLATPHTSS